MVATNITLSQSSIIITRFNHVAHKHSSKKVKGALAVTAQKTPVYGTLLLPYVDNTYDVLEFVHVFQLHHVVYNYFMRFCNYILWF